MFDDTKGYNNEGAAEASSVPPRAKRRSIPLPLSAEDAKEVLETALNLAGQKVKVFACGSNRKPLSLIGWHSATMDEHEVEELFCEGKALLGLRPSDANLLVLDIPAEQINDPLVQALPKTFQVGTMNGGRQFYYRAQAGMKPLGSTDFRGFRVIHDQGHVLTWGNPGYTVLDPDAKFTEMPQWMIEEIRAPWKRGRVSRPGDEETEPDIEFWDKDRLFLRSPEGAVMMLGAREGCHKTNIAIAKSLDAILERGAKVFYAAGEGAYGVKKIRVPAQCRARQMEPRRIRDNLAYYSAVPQLNNPVSVAAFIETVEDEMPDVDILWIDTYATATPGMDENGSAFSSLLTDNGPVGQIKRRFKCLIVVVVHMGKKEEAGLRGHSGLQGNVDGVLLIKFWKDSGALSIYAHKIKDAPDNFHVYYKIPQVGSKAVPVPERIEEAEFKALTKGRKAVGEDDPEDEDANVEAHLLKVLRGFGDLGASVAGWSEASGYSRQTVSKYKEKLLAEGRIRQIGEGRKSKVACCEPGK
jgi:hypothetical protein